MYIEGKIQGVDVIFTADTGANCSIISKRVYSAIPEAVRPAMQHSAVSSILGANGQPLQEIGKVMVEFQLHTLKMTAEVIVADIADEVLLGIDILKNSTSGPADILLSKGVIQMGGITIPCFTNDHRCKIRRVLAAEDMIIPARSESIIDVFVVDSPSSRLKQNRKSMVIEPTKSFHNKYSLAMASALVSPNKHGFCQVRIMNPCPEAQPIHQNSTIGIAESIDNDAVLNVISQSENGCEEIQNNSIRHIQANDHKSKDEKIPEKIPGTTIEVPAHLQEMYHDAVKGRTDSQKQLVASVLLECVQAFSRDENDLGQTHLAEHIIDTADARPIKQRPRKVPLAFANEERKVIDDLKSKGVIRNSTSCWASPIVLVKKSNGKIRPCVDYRKLNEVTRKDAYPLPLIQDCLDSVAGAKFFSTFDLTSGYHQVPVRKEDIHKTAFCTKYGLFEFNVMPFGVTNGPATFQRVMELALQGLNWLTCLIYLDDVIVHAETFEEHVERVREFLWRMIEANLKLRPNKCQLLKKKVGFLGHVISEEGVLPNPENVNKLKNWLPPRTVTEVRQFLGLASYYRRFIKDFAELAAPLTQLTRKGTTFVWSSDCDLAFHKLKSILISPEVMAFPNDVDDYILDTDASDRSIGAVLSQVQNGRERVIAYASRTLNKAERNYCVTDRELLAVKNFAEYFRQYLLGRTFKIRTDHRALVWLFSMREPKSRIARWIEILSAFDFQIEFRQGTKHGNADGMSRCLNPKACECEKSSIEPLKCGPCQKCLKREIDMAGNCSRVTKVNRIKRNSGGLWRLTQLCCSRFVVAILWLASYLSWIGLQGTKGGAQLHLRAVKTRAMALKEVAEVEERPTSKKPTDDQIGGGSWVPWSPAYKAEQLRKLQDDDPDISPVIQWIEGGITPSAQELAVCSPATRHLHLQSDLLSIDNNILIRCFPKKDGSGNLKQLLVPQTMRKEIVYHEHNTILSGHLGVKKTRE